MRGESAVAIVNAILPDRGSIAMQGKATGAPRNRLADETSPYLAQHAANPVDWYPWGEAAIGRARELDRPILLSIGYSACHWCHVMAHESFEDEATAAAMNRLFVNVKVDREERPDLDKVYQLAHQVLTQRGGGWPLTMFLAPDDLTPFFGGTYFPDTPRYGMPAFADLIERVAAFYRDERAGVASQNAALRGVFADLAPPAADAAAAITRAPLDKARANLAASFDPRFGGFGPAPKFPHAASIELLLREWQASAAQPEPDLEARHMAVLTLRRMAEGGIFDQLGGGFCRYSVDPFWMIPHFEKMLYDNGPLLALCAQAAVATGDDCSARPRSRRPAGHCARCAPRTAAFLPRSTRTPKGTRVASTSGSGTRSSRSSLPTNTLCLRAATVSTASRISRAPGTCTPSSRWSKLQRNSRSRLKDAEALLDSARGKLLAARAKRIRPALDDKILTAWNALLVRGLAIAGRLLEAPALVDAALRAVDFLRANAWRDGQLYASWKGGAARFPAYLDDHAFLLDALIEAMQARFRVEDLHFARRGRRRAPVEVRRS